MNGRGIWLLSLVALVAACTAAPATEPDRVATRVAEDLAVAATLTAVAPQSPMQFPTSTSEPMATETPPEPEPTDTPIAMEATATIPEPTEEPPEPTVAPTPDDPVVPGFGNTNGLTGRIILPGYEGPLEEPIIHDQLVFRLEVFDPDIGETDGDGITSVDISIGDPQGNQPYAITLDAPPYCAFAGDPVCDVYVFAENDTAWPDGTPICAGSGYQANMTVHTDNPERDGAFWGFNFSIEGDYPSCN